ncbi:MAG: DUF885 domain-containing protein [Gammaproteobacteria bacterium]
MKRILIFLLALLALVSTGRADESPATASAAEDSPAEQLDRLFEDFWEASLELNPVRATFIGDHRYNDRFPVLISPEHLEASKALLQGSLAAVEAIAPAQLDEQRRLSRDLFLREVRHELEGYRFPAELMPINQFRSVANMFAMLGSGTSAQPFDTVVDYENFLKRMDGFTAWVAQAIVNMRAGMEAGVVPPAILMERVIPQLEAHIVAKPADSLFHRPVAEFPDAVPEAERGRLRAAYEAAITGELVPAYARLRDFIREEYLPACRDTFGLYALPDGEAWYQYLIREHTTTGMSAGRIHQLGLDEVARIHREMIAIKEEVGFEGGLQAFFDHLNTDPKFYFETSEEIIAAHEALRAKADAAAPRLFKRLPKAGYEIRPVEAFRERSAAKGSYQRPSTDGSRPGIFYVNTWNPGARPRWDTEALFLHEAVPGHHFQRSFNLELEGLPAFRQHGGVTAFAEGWGLYAESLPVGRAMGFYQDPYQRFGELNAELWRAIRLVVDTGLHAKGWSRQQVLDYMYANSATLETRAVSEAERFMAIPGQALAYKIGQIKIAELRARAEAALGERFDVREFHARVLGNGDLPLDILELQIDAWIASQGPAPAG